MLLIRKQIKILVILAESGETPIQRINSFHLFRKK